MPETVTRQLSRFKPEPRRAPRMQLMPRDLQMLRTLGDYRFMTREMLQSLFFRGKTQASVRLQRLFHHRYVDRLYVPRFYAFDRVERVFGNSPAIYFLTLRGAQVVGEAYDLPLKSIAWVRRPGDVSPLFLEHQLLVSEFRIAISLAAQQREGHQLLTWLGDLEAKDKYLVFDRREGDRRVKPFTPDAFFTYAAPDPDPAKKPGRIAGFLEIEVTRKEERRLLEKFRRYAEYSKSGGHLEKFGVSKFRVLCVVQTKQRVKRYLDLAYKAGIGNAFWATTREQLTAARILEPVWWRIGTDESQKLISWDT